MKKLSVIFSLVFIICLSQTFNCHDNTSSSIRLKTEPIRAKMWANYTRLGDISKKIRNMEELSRDDLPKIAMLGELTHQFVLIAYYDSILLQVLPKIRDDVAAWWYNEIGKTFQASQQALNMGIEKLQALYSVIENDTALHLLDAAKEEIRISIDLYDELKPILQQHIQAK